MILKAVNKLLGILGLEMRRKMPQAIIFNRASMRGVLKQALKNGLDPQTVIDVGAATGTPELYEIFPRARHILIEPLKEFTSCLKRIAAGLEKAEFVPAAAAAKPGEITINVHPDLVGSSIYKESEKSDVNGVERKVPAVTLDGIAREKKAAGPYLIKIDTQGSELEVLKGAPGILKEAEFVILEISLFEFFKGAPLIYDAVSFMKDNGFVVYDIFDISYRPLDGAVSQANVAFVKEDGKFREFHFYATMTQRDEQTKRLCACLKKR